MATTTGTLTPARDPEAPRTAAVHHVHMLATPFFRFDPPMLDVAPGDVVKFHSHDVLHTATSGLFTETEPVEAAAPASLRLNSFNTGLVARDTTTLLTVGEPGNYPYYCAVGLHRLFFMHGVLRVT